MGMSVGAGGKGGRRKRGVPRYGAMADINMTPFIDVMLVLLIIFMVAAPLNVDQKPLSVAIDEKGDTFVNDQPVAFDGLAGQLSSMSKDGFDERIYVRAAKTVNYGRVAEVMSTITSAGFKKVALVTENDKQ